LEIRIKVEDISDGMVIRQDIISEIDGTIIAKNGTKISTENGSKISNLVVKKFHKHGITHVVVNVDNAVSYLEKNNIDSVKKPETISSDKSPLKQEPLKPPPKLPKPDIDIPKAKSSIDDELREEAVDSIRSMFSLANVPKTEENMTTAYRAVKEVEDVVDKLTKSLSGEADSFVCIADIKSYDEYTYHHSISVAILSIAIGQSMGLSEYEVQQLGRSAILHDIGKMMIPNEVINKPGRLTEEEFIEIKNHPAYGADLLAKWGIGDMAIRLGVLSHHEKMDGTGYPNKLKGKKIPLWARIISVADVYDAVTSYRSYRVPMTPAEAVDLISSQVGTAFDYEVVSVLLDKIELYPINTCLELSNGRFGLVIDNEYPMRPVLKMTDTGEKLDLLGLENLDIMIKRVVDSY